MKLPVLDFASSLYADIDFSNTTIVACQHILGTTVNLFEEFFAKGLRPENCYLLGKCYSTHSGTLKILRNMGIKVSDLSTAFDGSRSFDEQYSEYVKAFIDSVKTDGAFDKGKRVIVLDDGGFLLQRVQEVIDDVSCITGVEQTTSGFEKLKDTDLRFGVINVARSRTKLAVESPFIAAGVVRELEKRIQFDAEIRVLIVGQGAIGQAVKALLKDRSMVFGCDAYAEFCDFGGQYFEQLPAFDVIIGTTGKQILKESDLSMLKKGVVLASASSSDREFPAVEMRVAAAIIDDCHADLHVDDVWLLNGGFPINFAGQKNPTPPREIQLTRALLFAGVCEASKSLASGFHDLSEKQDCIAKEFQSYSKSR